MKKEEIITIHVLKKLDINDKKTGLGIEINYLKHCSKEDYNDIVDLLELPIQTMKHYHDDDKKVKI